MINNQKINNSQALILNNSNTRLFKIYKYTIYALSFIISFIIFLKTMNPSSFGYDTTWFHIQVPELAVGQTTGFPLAFLLGKLFTFLPFGTVAYRLNLFSVFWGAAAVTVFVMIISNLLKKEYFIALISTLFFAFFKMFWSQTNRFEVYTFHTFLIGLIILFGVYWIQSKKNKYLYLYYLSIGFSLTNHPLSLFLIPALIFFPVFVDWRSVFKVKKVFIIIALIIAPLLLYLYIPIRSFQGHGNITTWHKFFDYITGSKWKQQFGFKSFQIIKQQAYGYFNPIKSDFNITALFILVVGEVMLFIKNRKYFFLMLVLLISYLIPFYLYESSASDFYIIFMITLLIIPFSYGLYYIREGIIYIFKKISTRISLKSNLKSSKENFIPENVNIEENKSKIIMENPGILEKKNLHEISPCCNKYKKVKIIFLISFFIIITIFPVYLCVVNFPAVDKSKDTMIYDYWKTVIGEMKDNSVLITSSKSSSVAFYLTKYEFKKNIEIKIGLNEKKLMGYVKENMGKKNIYFNQVYLPPITPFFELKQIGYGIYWKDYREQLKTWEILSFKKYVDFASSETSIEMKFGDEKTFSYTIKNHSSTDLLKIDSIELELPKNLKLLGIDEAQSDIKDMPGRARGIYMWTKGPYVLEPGKELKVAVKVQAVAPGEDIIGFRITTMKIYEPAPDIKVLIN